MSFRYLLALLAQVLALCCSRSAIAEARTRPGLPAVNVAALAASRDRLYVGSFDQGLFIVERDGRARAFQDPALDAQINALAWSESERLLWVGTARGLVRCRMKQPTACRRIGPSKPVHALQLGGAGDLVAGGDAGLSFVHGDDARVFGKKQGAPFRSVWALSERAGTLFVGSTNGLFWAPSANFKPNGTLQRASLVQGSLPDDWVTALLSRGDRLYVGMYNAGVTSFRVQSQQLAVELTDLEPGYVNPAGIVALDGGELAIASMDGLRRGALTRTRRLGQAGRDVTAVARADGGYWIGTRQGLEMSEQLRSNRLEDASAGTTRAKAGEDSAER